MSSGSPMHMLLDQFFKPNPMKAFLNLIESSSWSRWTYSTRTWGSSSCRGWSCAFLVIQLFIPIFGGLNSMEYLLTIYNISIMEQVDRFRKDMGVLNMYMLVVVHVMACICFYSTTKLYCIQLDKF